MLKRVVLFCLAFFGAFLVVAATAPTSIPNADTIAGILVVGWGFLAPLTVYKVIPLDDAKMKALTMIVSVVIALIALVISGAFKGLDFSSAATLFTASGLVYGEQQFVWTLFKDHPKTAGAVT